MGVYIKLCGPCRRAISTGKERCTKMDRRRRKTCPRCRWAAMAPPSMARVSLGVYNTKEQAQAAYQEALVNRRRGIDLMPTDSTVGDVVERYFKDCGPYMDRRLPNVHSLICVRPISLAFILGCDANIAEQENRFARAPYCTFTG